jgi:hypothetical protein
MRHQLVIATAAFAACWSLSPSAALAQQGRVDPIFTAIYADGDGSVNSTELKSAAASIRKLDTEGDGVVSLNEASSKSNSSDGRGGGSWLGGYTEPPPANNVPDHPFNIIVGRSRTTAGPFAYCFTAM